MSGYELRLPEALAAEAETRAADIGMSVNQFVVDTLSRRLAAEVETRR
jgi:predicted HicB family RNase H-like nuclease